jgi:hypothetical protein
MKQTVADNRDEFLAVSGRDKEKLNYMKEKTVAYTLDGKPLNAHFTKSGKTYQINL